MRLILPALLIGGFVFAALVGTDFDGPAARLFSTERASSPSLHRRFCDTDHSTLSGGSKTIQICSFR